MALTDDAPEAHTYFPQSLPSDYPPFTIPYPVHYPLSPAPYSATRRICAPRPASFSSMHS